MYNTLLRYVGYRKLLGVSEGCFTCLLKCVQVTITWFSSSMPINELAILKPSDLY